jgi:hypothetical protein
MGHVSDYDLMTCFCDLCWRSSEAGSFARAWSESWIRTSWLGWFHARTGWWEELSQPSYYFV